MMTKRDSEVLDFLREYKVATTSILQYFFYPSLDVARRRLYILYKDKQVKRARDNINNEYIYFVKKPIQLKHSLEIINTFKELDKKYDIKYFKIEKSIGSIRPDAIFGYIENGKQKIGMLEIELSNKGLNLTKYDKFIKYEAEENSLHKFILFANIKGTITTKEFKI